MKRFFFLEPFVLDFFNTALFYMTRSVSLSLLTIASIAIGSKK